MCFSATASFVASAVLLSTGVTAIATSKNIPEKVLSLVPVLFAIQQFTEGVLWLALTHAVYAFLHNAAMYAFLIFAQVVWPVLVPLAVLLLEKEKGRKKILFVLLGIGILIGIYLSYSLFFFPPEALELNDHIKYDLDFPLSNSWLSGILYFVPTVISPLVSSVKLLRWLGAAIFISYIFTKIFYDNDVISIWCYFAALISFTVLFIIMRLNRKIAIASFK